MLTWKIQIDAIRVITNTKGRNLKKILAKKEQHPALSSAYEGLLNQPTTSIVKTHSQAKGQLRSVGANGTRYLRSFLPRIVRDLKIGHDEDRS